MLGQSATADYYGVLGVCVTADAIEIRRPYREQALLHHPDKNPDRVEDATQRFKHIAEAYSVLKDPLQRAAYDERGPSASSWRAGGAGEGCSMGTARELFREVFGDEFAATVEGATVIVVGASAPHIKAAVAATASRLTLVADRCGKSRVVKGAVAAHLSALTDEASAGAAKRARDEVLGRKCIDDLIRMLEEHARIVLEVQRGRQEQQVSFWRRAQLGQRRAAEPRRGLRSKSRSRVASPAAEAAPCGAGVAPRVKGAR